MLDCFCGFLSVCLTSTFSVVFQKKLQWWATVSHASEVRAQHLFCYHRHGPEEYGKGGRCRQRPLPGCRFRVENNLQCQVRVSYCTQWLNWGKENWSRRFDVTRSWQSWRYVSENKGCISQVPSPVLALCIKYTLFKSPHFPFLALSL